MVRMSYGKSTLGCGRRKLQNEVIDKANNSDYEGNNNKKEFWAFVSRTKGKKKRNVALINSVGGSVTKES